MRPVGLDRSKGQSHLLSNFGIRHTGEETENHDLRRTRVDRFEAAQRRFEGFLLVHDSKVPFDHAEWRIIHESLSFVIP